MTGILQILFAAYAGAETITADFLVVAGGGGVLLEQIQVALEAAVVIWKVA
jgi:hypothetical protein